jgi:hypothetical protein
VVERGGFEPPKAAPADLQSAPFDRSGTSPQQLRASAKDPIINKLTPRNNKKFWSWRWESNPQPADYKSAALPLSYASESGHYKLINISNQEKNSTFLFFPACP